MFGLEGKERQKKKDKKSYVLIRVSLLILEARINFIFYSCQRGRTLEFPSGILLKCPGTPLDPCFLEDNQLYWFCFCFFFFRQHSVNLHTQFLICAGKTKTSVNFSCLPRVTSFILAFGEKANRPPEGVAVDLILDQTALRRKST